jgi:glycosyltransferase involved in cell wall biosynthesis
MIETSPLVSIVVPSYNHEKYIQETIESIVNQTYDNIELIVIDDGSKDNSPQIIQKLSQKYGFEFIHRPNKGLSATLNEGIKLSKGKYWSVCASDDVLTHDKIDRQVRFMENNPDYGMCYGKVVLFNEKGLNTPLNIKYSRGGWIFDDLIKGRFWIPAVSNLIKKDVFLDVGYYDEELWVEDWDMWVRISHKYQIGFINEYIAKYRQHGSNISKQGWKLYEAKKDSLLKWKRLENYDEIIRLWHLRWFRALSRNHKKEARQYLSHAIRYFYYADCLIGLIKFFFIKENKN